MARPANRRGASAIVAGLHPQTVVAEPSGPATSKGLALGPGPHCHGAVAGYAETRTSVFPRFSPFSMRMNARGAFSRPSVTSSV
jgi:hypothetical protein